MKLYCLILFIICSSFVTGQSEIPVSPIKNTQDSGGMWITSAPPKKEVKGSPYLFKSWFNETKIYFSDKVYKITNFNYNIQSERFESKISDDSVVAINPRGIKKIEIGGKRFVRCLDPEFMRNSYFEKVANLGDKNLLRKFTVSIKEGTLNPMTLQPIKPDEFVKGEIFYLAGLDGDILKQIKLKKRTVLSLIEKDKVEDVKTYVSENRLKFNKVDDVIRILNYSKVL